MAKYTFFWTAAIAVLVLGILVFHTLPQTPSGNYYSVQERRMPCGRVLRREVVHQNDAWRKTVTLMDPTGRVLATKTRTVEPEQCARIQAGQFVEGLWTDCQVPM